MSHLDLQYPVHQLVCLSVCTAFVLLFLRALWRRYRYSGTLLLYESSPLHEFLVKNVPSFHSFTPSWWATSYHIQTFLFILRIGRSAFHRELVRLPDGGTCGLDWAYLKPRNCLRDTLLHFSLTEPHITVTRHTQVLRELNDSVSPPSATPPSPHHHFTDKPFYESELADGQQSDLVSHHPRDDDTPILVLLHGLTGDSSDFTVFCQDIVKRGWRAVVFIKRGHGGVPLTTPRFQAFGDTSDLAHCLSIIRDRYPKAPLYGVGFSAGAALLVGYCGRTGKNCLFKAGVLVSPAHNGYELFVRCSIHWFYRWLMGFLYRRLLKKNRKAVEHLIDVNHALASKNTREFDLRVSLPLNGYLRLPPDPSLQKKQEQEWQKHPAQYDCHYHHVDLDKHVDHSRHIPHSTFRGQKKHHHGRAQPLSSVQAKHDQQQQLESKKHAKNKNGHQLSSTEEADHIIEDAGKALVDYWLHNDPVLVLHRFSVPCLCINACDDPVGDLNYLTFHSFVDTKKSGGARSNDPRKSTVVRLQHDSTGYEAQRMFSGFGSSGLDSAQKKAAKRRAKRKEKNQGSSHHQQQQPQQPRPPLTRTPSASSTSNGSTSLSSLALSDEASDTIFDDQSSQSHFSSGMKSGQSHGAHVRQHFPWEITNPNLMMALSHMGGHCGFWEGPFANTSWAHRLSLDYLQAVSDYQAKQQQSKPTASLAEQPSVTLSTQRVGAKSKGSRDDLTSPMKQYRQLHARQMDKSRLVENVSSLH